MKPTTSPSDHLPTSQARLQRDLSVFQALALQDNERQERLTERSTTGTSCTYAARCGHTAVIHQVPIVQRMKLRAIIASALDLLDDRYDDAETSDN